MHVVSVESIHIPDTAIHPLNGEYVVSLRIVEGPAWMTPRDADDLADRILAASRLARNYKETDDD